MTNKEAYQLFCKEAPDLPVFAHNWYLDAVCEDGFWDIALVWENKKIIASMPYFLKKKWGFKYGTMPLHVKHLGPYLIPSKRSLKNQKKLFQKLIDQLPETAHFLQDFSPQIQNWLPFYWNGYEQTVRYTYILDLDNLETVFKNFNRNIRRNIRKAENELTIENELPIEQFYEINKMSFERQGIPIYFSFDLFRKHDKSLLENNKRQIFVVKDTQQNIHAVSYLIWDKKRAYYHLAGEDPAFRGSGASILLTWEAIRYTKEILNLSTFDFEGSMLRPIEAIRRQFGAMQEPYYRVWKYNSFLFKIISVARALARNR